MAAYDKEILDPYRWLEDLANPRVRAWVEQQNSEALTYLQTDTPFQQIQQELSEIWDYPKESIPEKYGQRYFFTANAGLQPQAALFLRERLEDEPHLLLDPNTLSQDGIVALLTTAVNPAGTLLVYGLAEQGSDWQCLHIRRIDEGQDYPEVLARTRFSSIAWSPDSRGFYYTRYPEPGTVAPGDEYCFQRVYYMIGRFQMLPSCFLRYSSSLSVNLLIFSLLPVRAFLRHKAPICATLSGKKLSIW